MKKPRVYIESTIISYLAAHRSANVIVVAHQRLTRDWWEAQRARFEVFISQLVVDEILLGDARAAIRRQSYISGVPSLDVTAAARELARSLMGQRAIPSNAAADALHVAAAAVHGMDYLLTWNCAHINNAARKYAIELICNTQGYLCPIICTPEELMDAPS